MSIPLISLPGLALASNRTEKLLELLRVYRVDRIALHSLVYLLQEVYGVDLGYRGCRWELYATGPFCRELETDLWELIEAGRVRVGTRGVLEPAELTARPRAEINGARLIREAWSIFLARAG
ncbi:hypothetical protein Hbut_0237 [Hyperthermus butylicus DSM 5456]|uniref:Uncharacterized protein n=1 Tax=Hyperthermus butylicus (strain DSM 5456 / JCM 9403 / PLM1-5) TaxID=415426 RepID=A2BJE8_HYPBU|nr:hypothetical protein Hbut_0237 [Hyperthermus butylicus DSM 5456]